MRCRCSGLSTDASFCLACFETSFLVCLALNSSSSASKAPCRRRRSDKPASVSPTRLNTELPTALAGSLSHCSCFITLCDTKSASLRVESNPLNAPTARRTPAAAGGAARGETLAPGERVPLLSTERPCCNAESDIIGGRGGPPPKRFLRLGEGAAKGVAATGTDSPAKTPGT